MKRRVIQLPILENDVPAPYRIHRCSICGRKVVNDESKEFGFRIQSFAVSVPDRSYQYTLLCWECIDKYVKEVDN